MPVAAPKPCSHPGCGVLVKGGGGRCQKHPATNGYADKFRKSRHERGYGVEWTKLRDIVLKRDAGLCQHCRKQGRVTLAREVDHITPKAEGGSDDEANLQALCSLCHAAKSKEESARGIRRGWGKE